MSPLDTITVQVWLDGDDDTDITSHVTRERLRAELERMQDDGVIRHYEIAARAA